MALLSTDHRSVCKPLHGAKDGSVGGGDRGVAGGTATPEVQQDGVGRQNAFVAERELAGPRFPPPLAPPFRGDIPTALGAHTICMCT